MSQQVKTILGVIAFVVVLGVAVFAYNALTRDTEPEIFAPADIQQVPNFTMLNAAGEEVELHSFFGTPIVLNFWTTWCRFCVIESPHFQALYQEAGGEIYIIKVNLREPRTTVENFMQENGYTFPLFFDVDGSAGNAFRVRGVPMTFFIDANGAEVGRVQGAVTEQTLWNGVGLIVGE